MPVKQRFDKRITSIYPRAIQQLLDGEGVERTEENRQEIIGLVYLWNYWPEIGKDIRSEAFKMLQKWNNKPSASR